MLIKAIVIILILSIIILIHELGHFLTAKATGIRVNEFGIGFPPRLFAFRRGETEYSLNLIPIGGFVRMLGRESPHPRSLYSKSSWIRLAVSAAGPMANMVLAFILFSIVFMIPITIVTGGEGIKVMHVAPNSPAAEANIQEGDIILSVAGQPVQLFTDIKSIIDARRGLDTEIILQRGEGEISVNLVPRIAPPDEEGPVGVGLGWATVYTTVHRYSFREAIARGGSIIIRTPDMIRKLIPTIIQKPADTLIGPIGVVQVAGEVMESGIASIIGLAGSISIGIALFNLIPIPPLDGARMILIIVEILRRGKRLSLEREQLIYMLGTALLITLTVAIWYNDILRLVRG